MSPNQSTAAFGIFAALYHSEIIYKKKNIIPFHANIIKTNISKCCELVSTFHITLSIHADSTKLFPLYPSPFVNPPSHIPLLHTYVPHPDTIQVNQGGIKMKLQTSPISYSSFIEAGNSKGWNES